jgi:PAS domain S-box-containing protein
MIAGDTSVRNDLKSQLAQMEGRYRGLLEAAPDAMVVVDEAGEIVLLNVQAERQFGYRRDELVGRKVKTIIPQGFAERLIADGTRTAAEALAQQIGTGIELSGRRKDGSEFPIEIMLSPLVSPEGTLVTAAIRDISVRKATERQLAQMEARYRGLLEAAPDAMVVVNQAGEIVLLNAQAEKQFGYRRDELVGQKAKNIIPEGFAERLIAVAHRSAKEALEQQIGTGIELCGRRRNGSEFPIEIMLGPMESSEGVLVTAAIRDITHRRRTAAQQAEHEDLRLQSSLLEEARQERARLQKQFLSHVSHELRTPLTAIYFFITNLLDGVVGEMTPDQRDHLQLALDNVKQLKDMVSDLLDITRVDTHKLTLESRHTNPVKLVAEVLNTCRTNALAKNITLCSNLAPDLPFMWADPARVRQIFINLIDNGIKFTPDGGVITIGAEAYEENGECLRLSVADTGCGIKRENLEQVFDRLAQVKTGAEASRSGLGLGLFIARELAVRHGGRIWVESNLGIGSTFFFTLPVFSLARLCAPVLKNSSLEGSSLALVRVDVPAFVNKDHEDYLLEIRSVLERCTVAGQDMLLPSMSDPDPEDTFFLLSSSPAGGPPAVVDRIASELQIFDKAPKLKPVISSTIVLVRPGSGDKHVDEVMAQIEQIAKTTSTHGEQPNEQ